MTKDSNNNILDINQLQRFKEILRVWKNLPTEGLIGQIISVTIHWTKKQRDRGIERQRDKRRDEETDRQTDRQTKRQRDKEMKRQRDRP